MFTHGTKLVSRFNYAFGFSAVAALLNPNEEKTPETGIKTRNMQGNMESGLDRVKHLFILSEHKEIHPEMAFTKNVFTTAFLVGFAYGGFKEYNKAYQYFIYNNDTTRFFSGNDAKQKLVLYSTKAFLKGGLISGTKFAILAGSFFLTSSVVAFYRNKYGVLEYTVAGGLTSSLKKFHLGPKGMLSGSISGGLAGTIFGICMWLLTIMTGNSLPNVRNFTYLVSIKDAENLVKAKDEHNEKMPFHSP